MSTVKLVLVLALVLASAEGGEFIQTDATPFIESYMQQELNFSVVTGFLPVNWYYAKNNASIFYELQTLQGIKFSDISPKEPIVFWFNGGPGCSSQIGAWGELGALYVIGKQMMLREYAWNRYAHLVFVDQPLKVGFSYIDDPSVLVNSTPTATKHFINFIYNFFQQNPNLKQNPIYLFGESYAGAYLPAFAQAVLSNSSLSFIQLKGVGIGDGWVEPSIQTQSYDQYFYSAGVASQFTKNDLIRQELLQKQYLQQKNYYMSSAMFDNMTNNTKFYGNININNFLQYNGGTAPLDYTYLLQDKAFAAGYGVPDYIPTFSNCYGPMYMAFYDDISMSRKEAIEFLLKKINVLIYNGQLDIIVNTPAALNWMDTIGWDKINNWKNQKKKIWYAPDQAAPIGSYKNYDKLAFALVYQAGHLVPNDQPKSALNLLRKALNWDW